MISNKKFKLDIDSSVNIDIDTTEFKTVNLQKIYDEVERSINFVK